MSWKLHPLRIGTPPNFVSDPLKFCGNNETLTNISSSSIDEKVIHNSKNPRLDEIKNLLITLEKGRGKTLKISPAGLVKIAYWISSNIQNEIIQSAHQIASAQRQKNNDPTPISIGYIDSILATLLMGLRANSSSGAPISKVGQPFNQAPWYVTDAGIENEANRIGCKPHPGEPFPEFKFRVLAYRQIPYEQYERDRREYSVRQ